MTSPMASMDVQFSTTSATQVASTDCSLFRYVSVHVVSQGGSSTVNFQGSNDNTNWVSIALSVNTSVGTSAAATSTTSSGQIWHGPLPYRFFRLNVTGIASGTTAGVCSFYAMPMAIAVGAQLVTPATPTASFTNSANTTNATSVKASAGTLYSMAGFNSGGGAAYIKLYNKASAPTVGTDVPVIILPMAAAGGGSMDFGATGIRMGTGIAFAITGGAANSDTTAVAAAQVQVALSYI